MGAPQENFIKPGFPSVFGFNADRSQIVIDLPLSSFYHSCTVFLSSFYHLSIIVLSLFYHCSIIFYHGSIIVLSSFYHGSIMVLSCFHHLPALPTFLYQAWFFTRDSALTDLAKKSGSKNRDNSRQIRTNQDSSGQFGTNRDSRSSRRCIFASSTGQKWRFVQKMKRICMPTGVHPLRRMSTYPGSFIFDHWVHLRPRAKQKKSFMGSQFYNLLFTTSPPSHQKIDRYGDRNHQSREGNRIHRRLGYAHSWKPFRNIGEYRDNTHHG